MWSRERARIQICDFGMSEMKDVEELKYDAYCTSLYRPPELWCRPIPEREVTTAVDHWGFGCVIFQIITWSMEGLMAPPRKGKTVLDSVQAWRRVFLLIHYHFFGFSSFLKKWLQTHLICCTFINELRNLHGHGDYERKALEAVQGWSWRLGPLGAAQQSFWNVENCDHDSLAPNRG